jgi:SNW domain-containing protein 1
MINHGVKVAALVFTSTALVEIVYGDDLDKLIKTSRFVPDKEFSVTDHTATRSGPVQVEDPFGLDQFLTQAKRASKRPKDDRDRRGEEGDKRKRQE